MNLTETTLLTSADFPLAEFTEHLRLGTGFTDDGGQDVLLETYLRAAMGAIEKRTNKVLLQRNFLWQVSRWRLENGAQALPVSPVSAVAGFSIFTAEGPGEPIDNNRFSLLADGQRPMLVPTSGSLPNLAYGGWAEIDFTAGYGDWGAIPADLRQAMLMLAATYYENREAMVNPGGQMPFGVAAILEPYKRVRLGGAS